MFLLQMGGLQDALSATCQIIMSGPGALEDARHAQGHTNMVPCNSAPAQACAFEPSSENEEDGALRLAMGCAADRFAEVTQGRN
jgi:hypothetical protein